MRLWRALGISILGYYVLGLAEIIIATVLHLDVLAPSFPLSFWVSSTLVTIALTFGLVQWYFRSHDHYGGKQGLFLGIFFVLVSMVLDLLYVSALDSGELLAWLLHSYYQVPGFWIHTLAILGTAVFVGHNHEKHRKNDRKLEYWSR